MSADLIEEIYLMNMLRNGFFLCKIITGENTGAAKNIEEWKFWKNWGNSVKAGNFTRGKEFEYCVCFTDSNWDLNTYVHRKKIMLLIKIYV